MQVPSELAGLLEQIGAPRSQADETQLEMIAGQWGQLVGNVSGPAEDASRVTQRIRAADEGASIEAFSAYQSEIHQYMTSGADAASAVEAGVRAYMKGTIALKKETITVLQKTYGVLRKIAGPLLKLAAPLIKLVKPIIDKILSWARQIIESMFKRLWRFVVQTLSPLFKRAAARAQQGHRLPTPLLRRKVA